MNLAYFNASTPRGMIGLFVLALVISLVLTRLIEFWARRSGVVSSPNAGRWHRTSTPILGGVGIYAAFTVTMLLGLPALKQAQVGGVLIGAAMIFALGCVDDLRGLRPHTKLIGQILVACVAVLFGIVFAPQAERFWTIPLTLFWIIGITNAFNLLDNMDGLSAGVAIIASAVLAVHAWLNGITFVTVSAVALIGATLGFLRYNFHPARIFMGDGGSLLLGYTIAVMSVLGTATKVSNVLVTLLIPMLVLAVPIFDTTLVTLLRKLRRQPASQGGKDHTSHRLVYLGLSEPRAVLVLYAISAFMGLCALFYSRYAVDVVSVIVLLALIAIFFFGLFLSGVKLEEHDARGSRAALVDGIPLFAVIVHNRLVFEVLTDLVLLCISYYAAWLLRFEGEISQANFQLILRSLPWVVGIKLVSFFYGGIYTRVWRYYGLTDLKSIIKANSIGSILSVILITLLFRFIEYSRAVFVADWMIGLLLMAGVRILLPMLRESFSQLPRKGVRVMIIGAGDAGEMLLRELRNNASLDYYPVGFVDDDPGKLGRSIHGLPILGTRQSIPHLTQEMDIAEVLIAIPSASDESLAEIYRLCTDSGVPYKRMARILG